MGTWIPLDRSRVQSQKVTRRFRLCRPGPHVPFTFSRKAPKLARSIFSEYQIKLLGLIFLKKFSFLFYTYNLLGINFDIFSKNKNKTLMSCIISNMIAVGHDIPVLHRFLMPFVFIFTYLPLESNGREVAGS